MNGVLGRVLVDEHPRWHDRIGLDHLEDVALRRAQMIEVTKRCLDVGESAQGPEVEPVVVVEGRLLA